jgi:hypothetical protein
MRPDRRRWNNYGRPTEELRGARSRRLKASAPRCSSMMAPPHRYSPLIPPQVVGWVAVGRDGGSRFTAT